MIYHERAPILGEVKLVGKFNLLNLQTEKLHSVHFLEESSSYVFTFKIPLFSLKNAQHSHKLASAEERSQQLSLPCPTTPAASIRQQFGHQPLGSAVGHKILNNYLTFCFNSSFN